METIKLKAKINKDGHIKIDVPTAMREGEVDIVLVIDKIREKGKKYDFSDIAGKLQWNGDPLEVQRTLRDEW